MARPDKEGAVKELSARFSESDGALLTEYRGLGVGEMAQVRNALRESGAEYKVSKNTLTRIAVRELGMDSLVGELRGPTAIAFIKGDAVEAAKALDDAVKQFPVLVVKGGVLEGRVLTADQVKDLAKLEPRDTQLAKIAMMMNQPAQLTVNVFAALLRDLGSMLTQVITKKESGELGAGEEQGAEEAPAVTDVGAQLESPPETPAEQDETDAAADQGSTEEE